MLKLLSSVFIVLFSCFSDFAVSWPLIRSFKMMALAGVKFVSNEIFPPLLEFRLNPLLTSAMAMLEICWHESI